MTFRYPDPETAERLFDDLRRVEEGTLDTYCILGHAPTISGYKLVHGWSHALSGVVHDHPRLQDGTTIVTSQLFFLDTQLGLARTMNRWYRIGGSRHEMQ